MSLNLLDAFLPEKSCYAEQDSCLKLGAFLPKKILLCWAGHLSETGCFFARRSCYAKQYPSETGCFSARMNWLCYAGLLSETGCIFDRRSFYAKQNSWLKLGAFLPEKSCYAKQDSCLKLNAFLPEKSCYAKQDSCQKQTPTFLWQQKPLSLKHMNLQRFKD